MRFSNQFLCALSVLSVVRAQYDFSITHTNMSTEWNQAEWELATYDLVPHLYQSRMSLANGYVGASLASVGPFFEYDRNETNPEGSEPANVWPLFSRRLSFATISGFYNIQENGTGTNYPWLQQYGYESFIAGIPHMTGILYTFGDTTLDSDVDNGTISDFQSTMNFKRGLSGWNYIWSPEGVDAQFNVSFQALFSRKQPNLVAVKSTITPNKDVSGKVTDVLDGRSAVRSYLANKTLDQNSTTIEVSFHPDGLANITGYEVSQAKFDNGFTDLNSRVEASEPIVSGNETTIGQTFDINLKAGQTATFYKFIGIASNDKFENAESVARQAAQGGAESGWDAILNEHEDAWGRLMTNRTVDNFTDPSTNRLPDDREVKILQITSVANTYYLLQQLLPDGSGLNDNSISVGGLSSESYAGMIFWDADYWMAPGLNLNFPGYSRQISNFRQKQYPQAIENAKFNNFTNNAVLYSWTAGRYGNCTGTGPCVDYEYHLNHDIAFNLLQEYNITQNETWFNNGPRQIIESVASMVEQLLDWNATSQTWWVHNMTDPDEYANHEDNGAFTIASSADLLQVVNEMNRNEGKPVNELWTNMTENIQFPQAGPGITLEYQKMNNSVEVKQADVVLLSYPLDYDQNGYNVTNRQLDLDYYSNRQSPDGPAMTYSIHAIVANAISPSGCAAYTYTLNGILPYLRAPWFQFSEQNDDNVITNGRQNPAFPFLTGHGGANQIVPFGFLGLRTDQPELFLSPSLPPQIPRVVIRDFYFGGAGFAAVMNRTHTELTRFSTDNIPEVTDKWANGSVPIIVGTPVPEAEESYSIAIGETIYIPNRQYFKNATNPGNLLQCRQIYSYDHYAPGQFPQGAVDGAIATVWQPSSNRSAWIMVNTTSAPYQPIKELYFNWGARPPMNATVYIGNTTKDCDGRQELVGQIIEIPIDAISPSDRYDEQEAAAAVVVPYVGNSTRLILGNEVWSGNFAKLVIEGCFECARQEEEGQEPGATVAEWALIGKDDYEQKYGPEMSNTEWYSEASGNSSIVPQAGSSNGTHASGESRGNGTTAGPAANEMISGQKSKVYGRVVKRNLYEKEY